MSIPTCSKRGCDCISPTRYSSVYGYLCRDCFDTLVALGAKTDIEYFLRRDMSNKEASEAYFEHIFKKVE